MAHKQTEKPPTSKPRNRHYSRQWMTFMEFVHRQEEARSRACKARRSQGHEAPTSRQWIFELLELLLAGALLFAFMSLLLLIVN